MMDSAPAIGYTPVSALRRNHFLTVRDELDAPSLTDNRARDDSALVTRMAAPAAGFAMRRK